jgi:hypothetical protein
LPWGDIADFSRPLFTYNTYRFAASKLYLSRDCPEMKQAAAGFEPANNGFANRRLRPLGHAANLKIRLRLREITPFGNRILTTALRKPS